MTKIWCRPSDSSIISSRYNIVGVLSKIFNFFFFLIYKVARKTLAFRVDVRFGVKLFTVFTIEHHGACHTTPIAFTTVAIPK